MSSFAKASTFWALSSLGLFLSAGPAFAQAWGEQAPVQFKYSNQGLAEEVYRNQLGTSAAAAAAAASSSSLGSGGSGGLGGQSSSQLNNAIQTNSNNTYNITVSGSNDYLNLSGTVNATQTSNGTTQTSSNSNGSGTGSSSGHKHDSTYLNH